MPMSLSDNSGLLYRPEKMDTGKTLWFVPDVLDMDALEINGVTCQSPESFKTCRDFLYSFPSVFVAFAEKADEVAEDLALYCPDLSIMTPRPGAFGKCKTIREVLQTGGRKQVDHLLLGAVERPVEGLLDLSAVKRQSMRGVPAAFSNIGRLDKAIGGFYAGEVSVWTGKRGGGKSTILGQELLEAVDQGFPVCAYSGELPAWRFKDWIVQQAAGPDHVTPFIDQVTGKEGFDVDKAAEQKINGWLREKFFLYDNRVSSAHEEDSIIRVFEYAMRKYGCCIFLVDNLMTTRFKGDGKDFYRAQSLFTGRLVEFAKKNEVHVHLVAHPRKGAITDADSVSGSGDVTNRADNVFTMERLTSEAAEEKGFQVVLEVLKNRDYGETIKIGLNYDPRSRRFYPPDGNPNKRYGWE